MTDKLGDNISFCELITDGESEQKPLKLNFAIRWCPPIEVDELSKTTREIGVDELVDMIFSSIPR